MGTSEQQDIRAHLPKVTLGKVPKVQKPRVNRFPLLWGKNCSQLLSQINAAIQLIQFKQRLITLNTSLRLNRVLLAPSSLQRQPPALLCAPHHCQDSSASESRDYTAAGTLPVNWLHFPPAGKTGFFPFSIQEKKHLLLPISRKREGISICLTPEGKKQPFERKVGWGVFVF